VKEETPYPITPFRHKRPHISPDVFVDRSARIIGDVAIGKGSSIWPMAILRADSESIKIGKKVAILDRVLIEAPRKHPVYIKDGSLISHGAIIHGAHIMPHVLIGIGAIILDGAVIDQGSIIGAGSIVPPGTHIPPHSLVMGIPGKIVRRTTAKERRTILEQIKELYEKSRQYLAIHTNL